MVTLATAAGETEEGRRPRSRGEGWKKVGEGREREGEAVSQAVSKKGGRDKRSMHISTRRDMGSAIFFHCLCSLSPAYDVPVST